MRQAAGLLISIVALAVGCESVTEAEPYPASGAAAAPALPSAGASAAPTAGTSAGAAGTSAAPGGSDTSTAPPGQAGSSGMQTPVGAAGSAPGSGAAGSTPGSGAAGGAPESGAAGASAGAPGSAGTAGTSSGGAAGSVAGVPAAGGGGAAGGEGSPTAFKRPCVAAGNEVVFIGDSYSDYAIAHGPMASFVTGLAVEAGALSAGDSYRNLAVAGTTLATPPAAIQGQWTDAMSRTPIKAVVMTGGGNDVLIDNQQCRADGSESRPDCQMVVANSLAAAKKLFESMKQTGVSDVVYFWYPHIPGGLLTGYETGATISDYTYPMLEALAESSSTDTFHVHVVPTVDIFEGHPEYFYSDGLHANDDGTAKIAEAIWQTMESNCIAQAASSGCCEP